MNHTPLSFGAHESKKDKRTIKHEEMQTMAGMPLLQGGYDYGLTDIDHQHYVGICTAISLTQNASKALNKKFSPDFQYLLQKKFYDLNWDEGSSIFYALKVGKNYGFLPLELMTYITEEDRKLPYSQYIFKLQSIPEAEVQRLISLCTDKLQGYAQVNIDSQTLAKAIVDSKSGILCRYSVGEEWYTAPDGRISWNPADINPLRPPQNASSGHAITMSKFDFVVNLNSILANTWGTEWNRQGLADIFFNRYAPTEAWIPYYGLTAEQIQELKDKLNKTQLSLIEVLKTYIDYLKGLLIGKKTG